MGVVAARLPFPVRLRVTSAAASGPLIVAAVLGSKALLTRPCLDQRAVDREVLLRQQAARVCVAHDLSEQAFDHVMLQQAVAVLEKSRVVPDRVIERQADEPAKQQVVAQLLAQLPLASHRVEHLQQQGPDQLLRGDRVATGVRIHRVKPRIKRNQGIVHQQSNGPQRMISRDKVVQLRYREQAFLHRVGTAHRSDLEGTVRKTPTRTIDPTGAVTSRFSTAC